MITTLVQFKLPAPVTCDRARAIFSEAAPQFRRVPGLIRKYFLLSEDGATAGGVYLWESREDAERFYTAEFERAIVHRFGSEPSITYFQSPIIVDNLVGATLSVQ
jgi:heme-degrading monooxygenase HmoA